MKVKELIEVLQSQDSDAEVGVQKNHGEGYFTIHSPQVQPTGHIGFSGFLIHLGEEVTDNYKASTVNGQD
jgi:hypothetical protein